MKQISKSLLLAVTILFSMAINCMAAELELKQEEKEPTYEETVEFLTTSKLTDSGGGEVIFKSFDNCTMEFDKNSVFSGGKYGKLYDKFIVNLRLIKSATSKCDGSNFVKIDSNSDYNSIREKPARLWNNIKYEPDGSLRSSSELIFIKSCDDAERIAKAISHLLKLCRPKPSPF